MNPRTKNLALAGGAVIVIGFVAVNTLVAPAAPIVEPSPLRAGSHAGRAADPSPGIGAVSGPSPAAGAHAIAPSPGAASRVASPLASNGASVPADPSRRSYAIGLQDLAGLPPDAAPGARLELWVTWEPPITRRPRLQRLIGDVLLERIIPGSVPEAPVTVLLSVPTDRVGDLIYADGFGRLSVVLPE